MSEKTTIINQKQTRVAVIGAGHAGVEAALASARLGVDTVLFTMSLDAIANLPCNPSIGGTAKLAIEPPLEKLILSNEHPAAAAAPSIHAVPLRKSRLLDSLLAIPILVLSVFSFTIKRETILRQS